MGQVVQKFDSGFALAVAALVAAASSENFDSAEPAVFLPHTATRHTYFGPVASAGSARIASAGSDQTAVSHAVVVHKSLD